jgi:hypothetical protein
MTTQSFPVGGAPRIVVSECRGDLEISVGDDRVVELECDGRIDRVNSNDEALTIDGVYDDLELRVPADAEIIIDRVHGDARIHGARTLTISEARGDVEVADVQNGVRIDKVGNGLEVHDVDSLVVTSAVGADVRAHDVGVVVLQQVGGDLEIHDAQSITLDNVGGDCNVSSAEVLRYGNIGGDLQIDGNSRTVVVGGGVGGDAGIHAVMSVHLGDVGGDCSINSAEGEVRLGSIGGDCQINDVSGDIAVGEAGGDCSINAEHARVRIGNVGGDLHLASAFLPEGATRVTVGGDATIELPRDANLTLRATVGGDVSGERIVASGGGMFTAVYGDGAAQVDLLVGGDLSLSGGGMPRSSSSSSGWSDFGEELGRMGEELGREFSHMGEELERELSGMFGPHGKYSSDAWEHKVKQRVAEQLRRAEERARRAEERVRRATDASRRQSGDASGRVHVRINDREWRFDAERLERLKQQARDATREGISGAIAAMERALASLGVPPDAPAPVPPVGPVPPVPPVPPRAPATGQTIRIDVPPASDAPNAELGADVSPDVEAQAANAPAAEPPHNIEEERAAILQMIAEGRISPEEGDMLLDALGS